MKTSLDCISCFLRQSLDAAKLVSNDPLVHESILREVLRWTAEMDFAEPPPVIGQRIHRRLREMTGFHDPYRSIKAQHNRLILGFYPELKKQIEESAEPLAAAAHLAVAGNIIDLGVKSRFSEAEMMESLQRALSEPIIGNLSRFKRMTEEAKNILYLADNAGEIVFDRLLIEQLGPDRVTVVVRGAPVINDATMLEASEVGLCNLVEVMDNGSDAPGTVLDDCCEIFRNRFEQADLIIAKGQGNYETLSGCVAQRIYFLFKVKCSVIAEHVGAPVGSNVVAPSEAAVENFRSAL